jgi:DNA-binding MarR family transcriptional regulator
MIHDVVRRLGYLALGTRLKRLGERMQADTQRILDEHGLAIPTAQLPFLAAIDLLGASTIGDLADAVGVSQPGATRALAQLADGDFVAITTASDDQRRKLVALAPRGAHLVAVAKREVWPLIETAVRELCKAASGPLLDQLAAIEDGLAAQPLDRRAATVRTRKLPGARRPRATAENAR